VNRIFGDWLRLLIVVGLVSATTGYVWVKVQITETAMGIAQAQKSSEALRQTRSKLQAAVDLAQRPGVLRVRSTRELQMVDATVLTTSELIVGANLGG
tara:strand:- start:1432 stop:1725 length:294 start_codon:yes stop_codon:yes gene_type:complete